MKITVPKQADREYQDLLQLCKKREEAYLSIAGKLTEEDRQTVEAYISVCEELSYREGCLSGL